MTGDADDDVLAEAVDWRMRIDAAPGDATLRARLEAWLARSESHRRAYRDVERLTRVASSLPADYADATRQPARSRRARIFTATGALVLAACLAFLFLPTARIWLQSDHRTTTAELRNVTLEDGSAVALDAESAIAVRYTASRREVVLLAGRAYFDVMPHATRPFVVIADEMTVTVVGTAFDVGMSSGATTVAVQSGTVEVAVDGGRRPAATLTRGQGLEFDRTTGRIARSEISPADVAAWRGRRLIVDKATVADVVEELGRHYDGVLVLRDRTLGERRVSGVFDLRRPIDALQAAVRTHDGRVTSITPYVMVISGP